jgi:hypothetical protein
MNCPRCQGLMMEDHFFDCEGTQGFMWMRGWRCVDCGHAVDPLIDANRRLNALTMLATGSHGLPRSKERVVDARSIRQ